VYNVPKYPGVIALPARLTGAILFAATLLTVAHADRFTLTTSAEASRYDDPDHRDRNLQFLGSYRTPFWSVGVSAAYYDLGAIEPKPVPHGRGHNRTARQPILLGNRVIWVPATDRRPSGSPAARGWGDINVDGSYNVYDAGGDSPIVDLNIAAKIPTADKSQGFSTGKANWAVGTTITRPIGALTLSGTFTRNGNDRIPGLITRDTWSSDLSAAYDFAGGYCVALDLSWEQSPAAPIDSSRMLALTTSYAINPKNKLSVTVGHGIGDVDPVFDMTVSLSHSF